MVTTFQQVLPSYLDTRGAWLVRAFRAGLGAGELGLQEKGAESGFPSIIMT